MLLYSDRIRKLVLDHPVRDLRAIKPELSEMFPVLVDVSISVTHDDYGSICLDLFPGWSSVATSSSSKTITGRYSLGSGPFPGLGRVFPP